MSSIKEKTLDNLEVGDVVVSVDGKKYQVLVVVDNEQLIAGNVGGTSLYRMMVSLMKTQGYRVEKPLTIAERAAKSMLEAIGFKVER